MIDSAAAEAFAQLAKTTDKFERYENPHAQRIAVIADEIAQDFHLARHDRGSLYAAALLHDLGEVAMERDYIQATGKLSPEEDGSILPVTLLSVNARHRGSEQTARRNCSCVGITNGGMAPAILMRWGREEIPLAARILRVADAYASLTDARPFAALSQRNRQDAS